MPVVRKQLPRSITLTAPLAPLLLFRAVARECRHTTLRLAAGALAGALEFTFASAY